MTSIISKQEATLKSRLMKQLAITAPGFVALRHEDVRSCGIPDLSLSGLGRTTWYEFKHATPNFSTTGIQELTCVQLAATSRCWYVLWHENPKTPFKRTYIYHPKYIQGHKGIWANCGICDVNFEGFDMKTLAEWMVKAND